VSIALPTSLPSVSGWQVVDWADPTFVSPPAASGLATIELPQLPPTDMWLIDHMVAYCTSSTVTSMRLYAGPVSPSNFRDGTDTGNFGVGDWPTGLLVRPSVSLTAQWAGCSDGARATLTLQARVMRQAS
jgi:hypothetical protein